MKDILETCAQTIAETTHTIIHYDVLITNNKGIIIGTNQHHRLGKLHAHSLDVIKKGIAETQDSQQAKRQGVRPGICLPIRVGSEVVGTVAIAGNPNRVAKYGHLAQREAEIFLHERLSMQATFFQENAIANLVNQLISSETKHDGIDFSYLNSQAKSLGLELSLPRKAIIIDIKDFTSAVNSIHLNPFVGDDAEIRIQTEKMAILHRIRDVFNDTQDIVSHIGSDKYVAIIRARPHGFSETKEINAKAEYLAKLILKSGYHSIIGIGTLAQDSSGLKESFRCAWCAINIGKKLQNTSAVYNIDDLDIQDILLSANRQKIKNYGDKVLKSLFSHPQWNSEYEQTLREWLRYQHPGKTSRILGLHRNSFLYRINRISEMGNIDIKDPDTIFQLKIALLIHDLM